MIYDTDTIAIREEFKTYLKVHGYGMAYHDNITKFLEFCDNNDIKICDITYDNISNYILMLQENNFSKNYINVLLKSVRCLYRFLIDSGQASITQLETVKKFKLLKVDRKIKNFITKKELDELISNGISFIRTMKATKLKAVLYFMFYTGVRKGELLNLQRKDIDLELLRAIIRTPTKNKQERIVFFPEMVKQLLIKYFDREAEEKDSNAFNLTSNKISYLFKHLDSFMTVDRKLTPHTFRHSFANMLASNEVSVRVAQKLLGHNSMQSTLIYYDPDINIVEKIYRKNIEKENE